MRIPATGATGNPAVQTVYFDGMGGGGTMGGGPVVANTGASLYRAAVSFYPSTTGGQTTTARILVTWPALGERTPNTAPKNYAGSYEAITMVDRKP